MNFKGSTDTLKCLDCILSELGGSGLVTSRWEDNLYVDSGNTRS